MTGAPPYFTPYEMARRHGMQRTAVIQFCIDNGVAIYQGRISEPEFTAALEGRRDD